MNTMKKTMSSVFNNIDAHGNFQWDQMATETACEKMVEKCECGAQLNAGSHTIGRSSSSSKTVDVTFEEPFSCTPTITASSLRIISPAQSKNVQYIVKNRGIPTTRAGSVSDSK